MQTERNTLVDEMSTDFAAWFQGQLKRREWSPSDFHRKSGIPRSTVFTWVSGSRLPDPGSVDVIADVFGLDVDDVLVIAGHRPSKDELKPDDPRLELVALMRRIRLTEDRTDGLRALLRGWLERDQEGR